MFIYVTVCTWGHHFPPLIWGPIRAFTLAFQSEWLAMLRWPGACADFPIKSNYDVIRTSSGDVPIMWGFLGDDIYVTSYVKIGGYKGWMPGGKGFPVPSFKFQGCRAHRDSLITSRVLWCAPTSGPTRNFTLFNYRDVLSSLIALGWCSLATHLLFLSASVACAWPSGQWAQPKELEYLVARTAILHKCQQRLRNRDQGVPGQLTPILVKLWQICGIPGWAPQELVSDSLNVII